MRSRVHRCLSLCIAAVCLSAAATSGRNVHVHVTDAGLDRLAADFRRWFVESVGERSYALPPYSDGRVRHSVAVSSVALTDATLDEVTVRNVSLERRRLDGDDEAVVGRPPRAVLADLHVDIGDLRARGSWSAKMLFRLGGRLSAQLRRVRLRLWHVRPAAVRGNPFVRGPLNCSVHVGQLHVTFEGTGSWLWNTVEPIFRSFIRAETESLLCAELVRALRQYLVDRLSLVDYQRPLFGTRLINYELETAPAFTHYGLVMSSAGDIYASNVFDFSSLFFATAANGNLPSVIGDIEAPDTVLYRVFVPYERIEAALNAVYATNITNLYLSPESALGHDVLRTSANAPIDAGTFFNTDCPPACGGGGGGADRIGCILSSLCGSFANHTASLWLRLDAAPSVAFANGRVRLGVPLLCDVYVRRRPSSAAAVYAHAITVRFNVSYALSPGALRVSATGDRVALDMRQWRRAAAVTRTRRTNTVLYRAAAAQRTGRSVRVDTEVETLLDMLMHWAEAVFAPRLQFPLPAVAGRACDHADVHFTEHFLVVHVA